MSTHSLPEFVPGLSAAAVDASLRQALGVCDRARECAALWFAEVQRRELYRVLGHPSLQVYATAGLGFSLNRYWQFRRLADDLERLPVLREAVASGELGWTKAQQVARVATPATQAAWVAKAAVTGRRELAHEVRQLRRRKSLSGEARSLFAEPAVAAPAEPVPVSINLRGDGLQVARFEALLEKAQKLGLVAAGADRLDAVLAGMEALVAGHGGAAAAAAGPAVQVVVHQCPDCGHAAAVTRRGELPLAPAQVAAAKCDACARPAGQTGRRSRRRRGPPFWRATDIGVRRLGAGPRSSWKCTMSWRGRVAARTSPGTWSHCAVGAIGSRMSTPADLRRRKWRIPIRPIRHPADKGRAMNTDDPLPAETAAPGAPCWS